MKIVVIGSISAGVSAARRISAGLKNVQISVYEKSAFFSGSRVSFASALAVILAPRE